MNRPNAWIFLAFAVAGLLVCLSPSRPPDTLREAPLPPPPPPEAAGPPAPDANPDAPPDADALAEAAPPPTSLLATNQVLAYYGNPYSPAMGILGEYDLPEVTRRVRAQAERYQALNTERTVLPALHIVYSVAQGSPGADGSFLYHMPDQVMQRYIEQTEAAGLLLFIDLQMGRADPITEVERVRHWLSYEHVHLAVDPEFTMAADQRPGVSIGSVDANTINNIQAILHEIALTSSISNKVLIVHHFQAEMISGKSAIVDDDRVDLVIDLDGFGDPGTKLEKYTALGTNQPVEYTGFKLFYRWDQPMMTEAEVQALKPRPSVVIYQ